MRGEVEVPVPLRILDSLALSARLASHLPAAEKWTVTKPPMPLFSAAHDWISHPATPRRSFGERAK